MNARSIITALFFACLCKSSMAQSQVKGKVVVAATDSALANVNITNLFSGKMSFSRGDGTFSIKADAGDRLVFSSTGYAPDTLLVQPQMFAGELDIALKERSLYLQEVIVSSKNYQADSIARREYYRKIYEQQPGITGGNRPANGLGVSVSPFSYFSKDARQKRILKKRLEQNEKEFYIDEMFSSSYVQRLTRLRGDSLQQFMYRYRPSYEFCRKTGKEDMLVYINDKLREFRKPATNK